MQQSSVVGFAQSVVTLFSLTVLLIGQNQQWLVKKYLLGFKVANSVLFFAFSFVASIPVKARQVVSNQSFLYITAIYNKIKY